MCKVLKKFTTVNFAFSGYADVKKYQEKPTFSCVSARRLLKLASSARAVIKLWGATLSLTVLPLLSFTTEMLLQHQEEDIN